MTRKRAFSFKSAEGSWPRFNPKDVARMTKRLREIARLKRGGRQ